MDHGLGDAAVIMHERRLHHPGHIKADQRQDLLAAVATEASSSTDKQPLTHKATERMKAVTLVPSKPR